MLLFQNDLGDYWNGEDFSIFSKEAPQNIINDLEDNSDQSESEKNTPCFLEEHSRRRSSAFDIFPESPLESSPTFSKGGRVLDAVIRPYAVKISGEPIYVNFNLENLSFNFILRTKKNSQNLVTEIFVPCYHYGKMGVRVNITSGKYSYDPKHQSLYWEIDHGNQLDAGLLDILNVNKHVIDNDNFDYHQIEILPHQDLAKNDSKCLIS